MNLILLGAPGAGKGTQGELLKKRLGIPTISTGNMLREAIRNGTQIGMKVKQHMDNGMLVPDDVVLDIVRERVERPDCRNGFILDGFPRTIAQGIALEQMGIHIDHVISIEVDDAVIEDRMTGRRVCGKCGASYHIVANPPKICDVCDECGGELHVRADDALETVHRRLVIYHKETEALKGFYEQLGKLRLVRGDVPIEDAFKAILGQIGV